MRYYITFKEISECTEEIDAQNMEEARDMAHNMIYSGEIQDYLADNADIDFNIEKE